MTPVVANLATNVRRAIYGVMAADGGTGGLVYREGERHPTTGALRGLLGSPTAAHRTHSIYYASAPDGAEAPYVIFHKQSGTPLYTFATGHAAGDNELWMVKGVARDDPDPAAEDPMDAADNIASRLDVLLTDGTISISGASQLYLRRESDVSYAEILDGESYYHHGALYRLWYSA